MFLGLFSFVWVSFDMVSAHEETDDVQFEVTYLFDKRPTQMKRGLCIWKETQKEKVEVEFEVTCLVTWV